MYLKLDQAVIEGVLMMGRKSLSLSDRQMAIAVKELGGVSK